MTDSTHRHPHTPSSAQLQDLPMQFQNKHGYNLVIAKQETDLISRSCAILPWTSSKACLLLHPFPGEELCPTARLSLLARINSAAPRCSSIFQPSFLGVDYYGVHELIFSSVIKCDVSMSKDVYANAVLSACTTMYPGIDYNRIQITALAPSNVKINAILPKCKYSMRMGSSTMAYCLPSSRNGSARRNRRNTALPSCTADDSRWTTTELCSHLFLTECAWKKKPRDNFVLFLNYIYIKFLVLLIQDLKTGMVKVTAADSG